MYSSSFRSQDIAKNTEIQKSENSFFLNLKSPQKSGRFDTRGSPVAFFVPELSVEISFTLYTVQCTASLI